MTHSSSASAHHLAAARHHHQASRHYREAARHFQVGKDSDHAAHQARIALSHAGHAEAQERLAQAHYQDQGVRVEPVPQEVTLRGEEHRYLVAAHHHDQAAHHHGFAVKWGEQQDIVKAARENYYAQSHSRHSALFGEAGESLHEEHGGRAGPSAEIA